MTLFLYLFIIYSAFFIFENKFFNSDVRADLGLTGAFGSGLGSGAENDRGGEAGALGIGLGELGVAGGTAVDNSFFDIDAAVFSI
jgi:hypothetical protein